VAGWVRDAHYPTAFGPQPSNEESAWCCPEYMQIPAIFCSQKNFSGAKNSSEPSEGRRFVSHDMKLQPSGQNGRVKSQAGVNWRVNECKTSNICRAHDQHPAPGTSRHSSHPSRLDCGRRSTGRRARPPPFEERRHPPTCVLPPLTCVMHIPTAVMANNHKPSPPVTLLKAVANGQSRFRPPSGILASSDLIRVSEGLQNSRKLLQF
jgi:hypothetical protein